MQIRQFDDGSGFTGTIRVISGRFRCTGRPYYFDGLEGFLATLTENFRKLSGQAELRAQHEKEFLRVSFGTRGRVKVAGLILEHGELMQRLEFNIETDQNFIPQFVKSISVVLADLKAKKLTHHGIRRFR
jgi:hypothetical protein